MSTGKFPLEPLCTVRGIRLRVLEAELKRCRELHDQAEQQYLAAADALALARQSRQDFAAASWQQLFDSHNPTGSAMDRHERHLALLDQVIEERKATLANCEQACAETRAALDQAVAAWRQGRNKLDAVGEMKQEWQREIRSRQELHEEHSLEELLLRQTHSS